MLLGLWDRPEGTEAGGGRSWRGRSCGRRSWRESWLRSAWVWGRFLGSCDSWLSSLSPFAADLADCKLVSFPICIYKVLRDVSDQIHLITLANNELKYLTSKFMTTFSQLRGRPEISSGKDCVTSP